MKATSDNLTPERRAETDALAALPDNQISMRDIPEQREWSDARRGALFRPAKHERVMKIQRMSDLEAEMRKVARGEITAPPDAPLPSVDSTEALDRNQSGIVSRLCKFKLNASCSVNCMVAIITRVVCTHGTKIEHPSWACDYLSLAG
jgi:hypothetical protein